DGEVLREAALRRAQQHKRQRHLDLLVYLDVLRHGHGRTALRRAKDLARPEVDDHAARPAVADVVQRQPQVDLALLVARLHGGVGNHNLRSPGVRAGAGRDALDVHADVLRLGKALPALRLMVVLELHRKLVVPGGDGVRYRAAQRDGLALADADGGDGRRALKLDKVLPLAQAHVDRVAVPRADVGERHRQRNLLPAPQRLRLDGPLHNVESGLADILPRRGHPLDMHADGLDLAERDARAARRAVAELQRDGVMPGRDRVRHRDAQLAAAGLAGPDLVDERAAVQPDKRRALADGD